MCRKQLLDPLDFEGGFGGCFVIQEQPEYKVAASEVKSHDDFAPDPADDGVHLDPKVQLMFIFVA